jgi:hypothetical protein
MQSERSLGSYFQSAGTARPFKLVKPKSSPARLPDFVEPMQAKLLMWSSPDLIGLFSNNVVLSGPLFSVNLVPKQRILSVRIV